MIFQIELDNQPKRFLKKADTILVKRISRKIEALRYEPVPHDAKRITNRKEPTFRVRVGNYRILYVVFYNEKQILISTIDKRPRVY